MKSSSHIILVACCVCLLGNTAMGQLLSLPKQVTDASLAQTTATVAIANQDQDKQQEEDIDADEDGKMLFNCRNWEWQRVIEVFTERTGLDLQPINDYPEGAVTIFSDQPMSVMEGLDKLNMNLSIKGYTLIRKENQLFLIELRDLNDDMAAIIEYVAPEKLAERGLYEIMRTTFDLSGLDADELEDSISARVTNRTHRQYLQYIPAAKKITVQEQGIVLREIYGWIQAAREEAVKKALGRRKYIANHLPVEIVLELARPMIGMEKDENQITFEDGTQLTMVSDPVERLIWVRSSNEKIDELFDVFKDIDVAPPTSDAGAIAKKYLKKHSVTFDREIAMQIMQSFFEGRDVVLDQDAQSGAILMYGTDKDHAEADEYLAVGANDFGSGLKSITLKYRTQTEIIALVNQALGITVSTDGTVTGTGPKIIPIPDTDAVFVMGDPQQVLIVERMVAQLDIPGAATGTGAVSSSRFIPMSESEAQRLINPDLEYIYRGTGRKNKLNFVTPAERSIPRRTLRDLDQMEQDFEDSFDLPKEDGNQNINDDQSSFEAFDSSRYQFASTQVQDREQVGKTSDQVQSEQDEDPINQETGDYYELPDIPESVPGSDITIRVVDGGIVVESDDLSALDDMIDLLYQLQDEVSEEDMPAVFHIKYRRPDVVKTYLDQYIGLSSADGGGGGGGMGGMLGNVMGNALGGPATDLFSGLLGGGGASDLAGGYVLEGDVTTFADVKLNYILVKGHTVNDYDMIRMYIDLLDRPESDNDIDLVGEMRSIAVIYRDPQEVYDFIVAALPEYLDTGEGGGGGNPEQQQQQMMQQMMKAIGGGGGGGGGQSIDNEAEKPKATISVDTTKSGLIVTGPTYIYEKVLEMVNVIDQKPVRANETSRLVSIPGIDPALVAQYIETVYAGKMTIVQGEAGNTDAATSARTTSQDGAQQQAQAQQRAAMQQIQRAMQQRAAGGGGRGGGNQGGRGGGGGGRGGGGRGGR